MNFSCFFTDLYENLIKYFNLLNTDMKNELNTLKR